MGVIVAVLLLVSLTVMSSQGTTPPPAPAIGDIRLVPYNKDPKLTEHYEVLIYYSDGKIKADFGGVCADDTYREEAKVICHQLGYEFVNFHYGVTNSPVWFNSIQCDDSDTMHILRCHTNVTSSGKRNSPTICGSNNYRLLVNCDFAHRQAMVPYDGQVSLCPVDITTGNTNMSSTSYGLVGIYYKDYDAQKGINQRDGRLLGANEADSICRQMGFTGAYPGTAVTRNVDNHAFENCFSNTGNTPPFRFQHGAWVTTGDIDCQGPQKCLGCCLNYPYRGTCNKEQCPEMDNLVIRCAFDPTKLKLSDSTAGSPNDCTLDSNKKVEQCESVDNSQEVITHLKIALGIVAAFLVLLGPCGCCCLCYCYKKYLHDHCKQKVNINIQHRRVVPAICCRDYIPIEQEHNNVENNRQNLQNLNQNQPA